ncbi:hypothetical protein L9F63_005721, partial [Diploptera punctata]
MHEGTNTLSERNMAFVGFNFYFRILGTNTWDLNQDADGAVGLDVGRWTPCCHLHHNASINLDDCSLMTQLATKQTGRHS